VIAVGSIAVDKYVQDGMLHIVSVQLGASNRKI